jgi:hypothetical protein
MSRFFSPKSEEARLESMADDSSLGDFDENDPSTVARFMKKMGKEFGDDLGDDFESAVDEAMEESASEDDGPESLPGAAGDTSDADL